MYTSYIRAKATLTHLSVRFKEEADAIGAVKAQDDGVRGRLIIVAWQMNRILALSLAAR